MRTLAAAAVLAYAKADETSLMQGKVRHASKLSVATSRQDSTAKLLETAVSMIKNGVTPDVITFVDSTNQEINEEVLAAIQREHDTDQAYIHSLCQDFMNAVQTLEDKAADIAVHDDNRLAASEAHQNCRKEEAFACAHSRRCEEQLRQKWVTVKHEESIMREIHGHIHDEWCIHPPFFAEIDVWLTNPFNWADMSPYPILDLPQDVRDFRQVSVTHFNDYMAQKIVVERAWHEYNEKLVECSALEEALEAQTPICDTAQITLREHACQHAVQNREAREEFGQEWDRINRLYDEAVIAKSANEQDRKNEWETLKIVQCLLDHVHSTVVESIETGAPCPTIDSDEEGVTLAIEDCHIVTRGCDEGSMTAHLCLEWCEKPPVPPLPPVEEPACTPAYVAREQASFLEAIQASYNEMLHAVDATYPDDALAQYNTVLSPAGWAGCAAPLVCVDCAGLETVLPVPTYENAPRTCHLHEEYLSPGQSNFDSFRCLDGSCIGMEGRCNSYANCADESDEAGCDAETEVFVPAYLAQSTECPADMTSVESDYLFQCANSRCIEKIGLCNGHDNCGDNSDEAHCTGSIHVTTEATSGRTITVETLQSHTGVFHDRQYSFDSLGDFAGKPFVKYSNDDKATDHDHVMTKIRSVEPLTVFIVKLDGHSLPWLETQGYTPSSHRGVSFSGVRETRHKEWDPTLLTTDTFEATQVYSKTFEAGTISIPGNNAGDGSFLVFLDRPHAEPPAPECGAGSPASCRATRVDLQCQYSAGDIVRIDHGHEVRRVTDQNSCPAGYKIFSPASQSDWQCLYDTLGVHRHHIGDPNRDRVGQGWPSSPWLIVDVSKAADQGTNGCNFPCPTSQRPEMHSTNPIVSEWHTSDGSPFWLSTTAGRQPDGNYNADCFLDIFNVEAVLRGDVGFDDHGCTPHSSSYLCQPEAAVVELPPIEEEEVCCQALTATCLACSAMLELEEYCAAHPDTQGCEAQQCGSEGLARCQGNSPCIDLREAEIHHHFMWLNQDGTAHVDGEAGGIGAGDSRTWTCTRTGNGVGLVGVWNCPGFYTTTITITPDYADDFTPARSNDWIHVCALPDEVHNEYGQPCTQGSATIAGIPVCTVESNDGNANPWVLFGDINHQISNFGAQQISASPTRSGLSRGDSVQVGTFSAGIIGSPGYSLDIGQFCSGGSCNANFDLMIQYGDSDVFSHSENGYSTTNGGFINNGRTAAGVVIGEHGMWGSTTDRPNGYYATFCAYNGGCRGHNNDFWAFSTHGVYPNAASSVVCGMYYGGSATPWKNCPGGDNGHRMRYYIRSSDLDVTLR